MINVPRHDFACPHSRHRAPGDNRLLLPVVGVFTGFLILNKSSTTSGLNVSILFTQLIAWRDVHLKQLKVKLPRNVPCLYYSDN